MNKTFNFPVIPSATQHLFKYPSAYIPSYLAAYVVPANRLTIEQLTDWLTCLPNGLPTAGTNEIELMLLEIT